MRHRRQLEEGTSSYPLRFLFDYIDPVKCSFPTCSFPTCR